MRRNGKTSLIRPPALETPSFCKVPQISEVPDTTLLRRQALASELGTNDLIAPR